ncbi:MAG: phosphoenolpyruvate--protein phosphotransferase [Candidatus Zixiibacteriota bacterium]
MTVRYADSERRWRGIAAAPGIALGPAFVYRLATEELSRRHLDPDVSVDDESRRLDEALSAVRAELLALKDESPSSVGSALGKIFDAQVLLVDDPTIRARVKEMIATQRLSAETAFAAVVGEAQQAIQRTADPYLREMANEIQAVKRRVIHRLLGVPELRDLCLLEPAILLAHTITPSDIISLKKEFVLGIVAETGGKTSHTALLAKSLGIPAVVGVGIDLRVVRPGTRVVVDGFSGLVIVEPRGQTVEFVERKKRRTHSPWPKRLDVLRDLPATTKDGHTLSLMANIDLAGETELVCAAGAAGVGLYRTEYLFLQQGSYPTENRQREVYRRAVETLGGRPLIVRTFDLGSDKALPDLPPESNPALGVRGVRISLAHPARLVSQFRALLAASAHGPVWVMVPMISTVEEFCEVQRLWAQAREDLGRRKSAIGRKVKLGLMIETPGAVRMAPELARRADFFSLGTNDLTQYTVAVDRGNARLERLHHYWHPSLWRQIADTVAAAHKARIPVGVCGEMAGDLLTTAPLLGLGVDSLSLHPNSVPRMKSLVRSLSFAKARQLAARILRTETADDVCTLATNFLKGAPTRERFQHPNHRRR